MKKTLLAILISVLSITSNAAELICPVGEHTSWDKMKESDFSVESVTKQLDELKKVFSGEIEVAEEFIWQANLVIEGGYLRREVEIWKSDPDNHKYAKERFCEFMSKKAYLVH